MWHVGQRVVCVDDVFEFDQHGCIDPVKGTIYTIRNIINHSHFHCAGLLLLEINNKPNASGHEQTFKITRFKPLDEKRLDIFREMLTVKEREKEIVK